MLVDKARVKLWLRRISKGLLVVAGLAMVMVVVAGILLSTAFPAIRGCEECGTHMSLVILTLLSIAVAMLCVVVAGVVALVSTWV